MPEWRATEHSPNEEPKEEGGLFLVEVSGHLRGRVCNIEYDHSLILARWYYTGWEPEDINMTEFVVHRWWKLPT